MADTPQPLTDKERATLEDLKARDAAVEAAAKEAGTNAGRAAVTSPEFAKVRSDLFEAHKLILTDPDLAFMVNGFDRLTERYATA